MQGGQCSIIRPSCNSVSSIPWHSYANAGHCRSAHGAPRIRWDWALPAGLAPGASFGMAFAQRPLAPLLSSCSCAAAACGRRGGGSARQRQRGGCRGGCGRSPGSAGGAQDSAHVRPEAAQGGRAQRGRAHGGRGRAGADRRPRDGAVRRAALVPVHVGRGRPDAECAQARPRTRWCRTCWRGALGA